MGQDSLQVVFGCSYKQWFYDPVHNIGKKRPHVNIPDFHHPFDEKGNISLDSKTLKQLVLLDDRDDSAIRSSFEFPDFVVSDCGIFIIGGKNSISNQPDTRHRAIMLSATDEFDTASDSGSESGSGHSTQRSESRSPSIFRRAGSRSASPSAPRSRSHSSSQVPGSRPGSPSPGAKPKAPQNSPASTRTRMTGSTGQSPSSNLAPSDSGSPLWRGHLDAVKIFFERHKYKRIIELVAARTDIERYTQGTTAELNRDPRPGHGWDAAVEIVVCTRRKVERQRGADVQDIFVHALEYFLECAYETLPAQGGLLSLAALRTWRVRVLQDIKNNEFQKKSEAAFARDRKEADYRALTNAQWKVKLTDLLNKLNSTPAKRKTMDGLEDERKTRKNPKVDGGSPDPNMQH